MENAMAIALVAGPVYLVGGLSLLMYTDTWKKVLAGWQKNHFLMLPLVFMDLVFGIIIVHMYNVWEWNIWLLITLTGWAMVLESIAYLLLPGTLLKAIITLKKSKGYLYAIGLFGVLAGGALSYFSYLA